MKSIFRIISFVTVLLAFGSCAKDIVDTTGNIVGTVRDARTNNLLQGASVTLSELGKSSTTGADGKYGFRDVQSQNYTVLVSKSGYKDDSKTIFVETGKDNTLDFSLTPSVAVLTLSKRTLDFGTAATNMSVDVRNTGTSVLTWQVIEDIPWLSCTPTSGTTQPGESSPIVVNVSREGLERGNYTQTVVVTSNGGSGEISVSMNVQGLSVSISPEALDFGSITTTMQLTLTNNGSGSVPYSITPSNEWISVPQKEGTLTSTEIVTVSVDRTKLSPGDYSGSLKVKLGSAESAVPVRMNIPAKEKPVVSLYSVDDVTFSSASFRGAIVSVGSAKVTSHGFCWSAGDEPTIDGEKCDLGDCSAPKDYTYAASSLKDNTAYHVRAYAVNAEGVSYSNSLSFKTEGTPDKPAVETGAVSGVTSSQAVVSGNIVGLGNVAEITQYGHVWGEKAAPTVSDRKTELGKTKDTGSFTSTLSGLKPNTTYHVRAYATNKVGTAYGEERQFTTPLGSVALQTSNASGITYNSATVGGTITESGGHTITERGVCWSTSAGPTVGSGNSVASASASDTFTVALAGLKENTKYYAKAYVNTANGQTYYGNEITFTTNEKDINFNRNNYNEDSNWNK